MALPVLARTWNFDINNVLGATGGIQGTRRQLMLAIKNMILGFPGGFWTVKYSCNSAVAGVAGDGVDRWTGLSDLIWATSTNVRSWIVLENSALGIEVLLHLFRTTGGTLEPSIQAYWTSHASGFTGGGTTTRPTATNEIAMRDGVSGSTSTWGDLGGTGDFNTVLTGQCSDDGLATRIIVWIAGQPQGFWMFEEAVPCHNAWTPPVVGMIYSLGNSSSTSCLTYALLNIPTTVGTTVPPACSFGVSQMQLHFTGEGHRGACEGSIHQAQNDLSLDFHLGPIGIASDTPSNRGRHGVFLDLWWANAGLANGAGAPSSSSPGNPLRQFIKVGDLLIPWDADVVGNVDGTVPLMT